MATTKVTRLLIIFNLHSPLHVYFGKIRGGVIHNITLIKKWHINIEIINKLNSIITCCNEENDINLENSSYLETPINIFLDTFSFKWIFIIWPDKWICISYPT